jgi:hypothetical protein
MLDLDQIEAIPFKVQISGKIYEIEDPGMDNVTRMIALSVKVKEDPLIITEYLLHMRSMTTVIPEHVYEKLSSAQVINLMKGMGEHFLSNVDSEGKKNGPLPRED